MGETKTGKLSAEAAVSSSKVYKILARLEKKGLCGHVVKGGVKYFQAMEPNRLLDFVDERQKQLSVKRVAIEKLLPQLELRKSSEKETAVTAFQGFKAVTNLFVNIRDELKQGEMYYVLGGGYGATPRLGDFFKKHHSMRARKKIRLKLLANHAMKKDLAASTKLLSEIRFLPEYLISNMQVVFYKNKAFIAIWTAVPTAVLIEDEEAVSSFRSYFDAFWKIARK